MGKFDVPPPYRSEKPPVLEWTEQFGEVEIKELSAPAAQKLLDIARADGPNGFEGKDVEYYANILAVCCTIGGDCPPFDWLITVPFPTLQRLGNIALRLNGMNREGQDVLEKN